MPEAPIKRTNFFDGQFLRMGEFNGMEEYHRHMRRRMLWVLFDRTGVVQLTPSDLALEVANAATKRIRVRAGTALGRRDDLVEAKEVVVLEDVEVDLNATALGAGDTGIVTLHYSEQPTDPSSEGGTTGNTRVSEQAVLTVHRNALPGPSAGNGEPYIRLGSVAYTSLAFTAPRDVAYLRAALLAPTSSIAISPNSATPGTTVTLALTATGVNLSALAVGDIDAMTGVTVVSIANRTATSADVTITVAPAAVTGARTFRLSIGSAAGVPLTITAGLALTGFTGVNTAAGDTTLELNGSGFAAPVTVEFPRPGGVVAVPLLNANITATQLRIPMADIPDNVIRGPVTVQSATGNVTSLFDVVPPARITAAFGRNAANNATPDVVRRGNLLRIEGSRFYTALSVQLGTYTTPVTFPNGALGESRSDTVIELLVPNALPTGTHPLTITTPGGSVRHAMNISVTNA